jgi:hypothetical protein
MSDTKEQRAPVSGSCAGCGCPLGFRASERDGEWFCCGACANSGRCTCGCKPEHARPAPSDAYVPGRRMFASRTGGEAARRRSFPFADPRRGQ